MESATREIVAPSAFAKPTARQVFAEYFDSRCLFGNNVPTFSEVGLPLSYAVDRLKNGVDKITCAVVSFASFGRFR